MTYYTESGEFDLRSLPAMLAFGIMSALASGVILGFITQWIDLLILFACLIGWAAGLGLKMGVKIGHCRNRSIVIVLSLAVGSLAYGMKNYMNYRQARQAVGLQIQEIVVKENGGQKPAGLETPSDYYDLYLEKTAGKKGFPGWVEMTLQQGVSISNHGSKGLNLGYYGSIVYFLVEILFAAWAAFSVAIGQIKVPYCEKCHDWSSEGLIQMTTPQFLIDFKTAMETHTDPDVDPPPLLAEVPAPALPGEHGKLSFHACSRCKDIFITGIILTPGENNQLAETPVFENMMVGGKTLLALRKTPPSEG
jgi:hypothetical protein